LTADATDGKTMQSTADAGGISGGSENACVRASHLQWQTSIATAAVVSRHSRYRAM